MNKLIFDKLIDKKEQIEQNFGHEIIWQRLDDKKACRVKCEMTNVNIFNRDDWDIISEFLIDRMVKFEKALKGPLKEIKGICSSK